MRKIAIIIIAIFFVSCTAIDLHDYKIEPNIVRLDKVLTGRRYYMEYIGIDDKPRIEARFFASRAEIDNKGKCIVYIKIVGNPEFANVPQIGPGVGIVLTFKLKDLKNTTIELRIDKDLDPFYIIKVE